MVVGSTYLNSLFTGNIPEPNPLVARFNADGTLDTTFGSGGFVNPQNFTPQSVAIEGASIILGGTYYPPNGGSEFALAELNANGTPDTTFGNGTGWVTTDVGASQSSTINAIAIQPDGEIVAAGSVNLYNPLEPSAFALARYNPDGSLDTSFGDADPANPGSEIGWTTTEFSGLTDGADQAFCVALESDGEIVLAGGTLNADGSASAAVAIYNTDGSLDTMFASGHDTEGGLYDSAAGVVVQPDGKIVTVSTSRDSGTVQAIRYEGSLQNVVAGEQQQSASPPPVVLQATTGPQVSADIGTVNSLTDVDPTNPVTIAIDLGGQTITTDTQINAPAGVTVVIQDGTLVGGSPALVVDSGNVVLDNVTAINATNAPTIVVNGGSLTLRGSTIQGSSAAPACPPS